MKMIIINNRLQAVFFIVIRINCGLGEKTSEERWLETDEKDLRATSSSGDVFKKATINDSDDKGSTDFFTSTISSEDKGNDDVTGNFIGI